MSNTRKAKPGSPFKQERFSSSNEFQRGLMANLVARRCEILEAKQDRSLIWFLQLLSHRPGGLKAVAKKLIELFPDNIHPEFYAATNFLNELPAAAEGLAENLERLCLDPSHSFEKPGPWYFSQLLEKLREFKKAWIQERQVVITEIGRQIFEELDYSLEARCVTLIDGHARIGKTHSAKAWCEAHPGEARYVQVSATNDDKSFYRDIAKSLGVSININSKAQELRQRIEDVLQTGQLMIVFDEAHYLWPNLIDPRTLPVRINWLMTALINHGVPASLVTTPQFLAGQKTIEEKTRWTSEQFIGRISHYKRLPNMLAQKDLLAVAESYLPDADKLCLQVLVEYAQTSKKFLAGIDAVARRARFLAARAGRSNVIPIDVKRAVLDGVIPSDNALAAAIAPKPRRRQSTYIEPIPAEDAAETESVDLTSERFSPRSLVSA